MYSLLPFWILNSMCNSKYKDIMLFHAYKMMIFWSVERILYMKVMFVCFILYIFVIEHNLLLWHIYLRDKLWILSALEIYIYIQGVHLKVLFLLYSVQTCTCTHTEHINKLCSSFVKTIWIGFSFEFYFP